MGRGLTRLLRGAMVFISTAWSRHVSVCCCSCVQLLLVWSYQIVREMGLTISLGEGKLTHICTDVSN